VVQSVWEGEERLSEAGFGGVLPVMAEPRVIACLGLGRMGRWRDLGTGSKVATRDAVGRVETGPPRSSAALGRAQQIQSTIPRTADSDWVRGRKVNVRRSAARGVSKDGWECVGRRRASVV
jgi:hypothetical protein